MKIAIDCRYIGKSGIGTYIENIVDGLLTEHPNHQYVLICEKGTTFENQNNVEIFETDIKPFSLRELFFFPVKVINSCDAYFTPYINIPGRINIPVFSTIHDVLFLDYPGLSSALGRWLRKQYIRRAIIMSSEVFTVSQFSKERIMYHFGTKKPIYVTYNIISKKIRDFDIPKGKKDDTIVFVGNIKAHKGLATLLKALKKAKQGGLSSKLLIVGNGKNFRTSDTRTMKLIDSMEDIVFTGFLPNQEMYTLIAKAKMLVLPSEYEGFGIPPMEALYLGTNAIVSDIPALKEVYGDFPVTFFQSGNSDELAEKLLEEYPQIDVKTIRTKIDTQYNIKRQVNQIIQELKAYTQR